MAPAVAVHCSVNEFPARLTEVILIAVGSPTGTKVPGGTGVVELNAAQIDELRNSRFYVQLHSEKAPEGNLWGWLLAQETKR